MFVAMLTAMSCTDEDNTVVPSSSVMMSFCGEDIQTDTRASFTTSMTSFGLSCSVYSSSATASSAAFGNYFLNKEIRNNATTEYFWPGSGKKCSFYAYYPYGNSNIILNSTTSSTGSPTYALTIPTDISKQVDFCVSEVTDVAGNYNSKVSLPFKHVCSVLSFKVKNTGSQTFTLKSVSFYGVKLSGTYSNGNWSTSGNASTASSNAMTITSNTSIAGGETLDVSGTSDNIIVIPQTIAADTEIFDVLISYNDEDKHYYYKLSEDLSMQKGTQYSYSISINCYDPYNGYEYVDLGLPSGTLWATCNVGATSPEQAGLYFAWGETEGCTAGQFPKSPSNTSTDLTLEEDAAHVKMGGDWRMPTKSQLQEMLSFCDATWTDDYNGTGVAGRIFTSKTNGNSMFLPLTGYIYSSNSVTNKATESVIWSSTISSTGFAWRLFSVNPSRQDKLNVSSTSVMTAHCVRGVITPPFIAESTPVDLGLPSGLKWAAGNIGATNPQDYGLYFAWGETTGYTAAQVKAGERAFSSTVYNAGSAASISTDLAGSNDAATVNLGGNWRMPTMEDFEELISCCYRTSVGSSDDNYGGFIFTSMINGNSVFFPAAGYCYSSSVSSQGSVGNYWSASWKSSDRAWRLYFNSGRVNVNNNNRYYGQSVRGVCK